MVGVVTWLRASGGIFSHLVPGVLLRGNNVVIVIRVLIASVVIVGVSKVGVLVITDSLVIHDNYKVEKELHWS